MEDGLVKVAEQAPLFLVMLGVIVVLVRALIRSNRQHGDSNVKLLRFANQQLEFMRAILGGKRWRKVDSDELEEIKR